jgi:hypothetical protein
MATLIKKNEKIVLNTCKNGGTLQFFAIDFVSAVDAVLEATTAGVPSPVYKAIEAIQARVSVETIHGLVDTNTKLVIGVAAIGGAYPTDNYDGTAGTETMAAYLEDLVQAVTYGGSSTIQGIDMSNVTVAAYTVGAAA